MRQCPKCEMEYRHDPAQCSCGYTFKNPTPRSHQSHPGEIAASGETTAAILHFLGWTALFLGLIGAIVALDQFGTVEIPVGAYGGTETVRNPVAGWWAAAIVVQGIVLWSICNGLGYVLDNQSVLIRTRNAPPAPAPHT